jgi:hypothetical protein
MWAEPKGGAVVTDVLNPADHQSEPADDREPQPPGSSGAVLTQPSSEEASAPGTTGATAAPEVEAGGATTEASSRPGWVPADDILSWAGAVANLGAAVIHFAYAQVHLDEEASHGAFFLGAGWVQLVLALGLGLRARPRRLWTAASVAVNLGIVGVWVVSRTVGVPGSDPESVGLADITATGLAVVAVLVGAVVLMGTVATQSAPRPGPAAIGLTALLVGGLVTASVTPAVAGGHGHEAGGHGHDMAGMEGMEGMEGMDHGHAGAGDDFAAARLEALYGYQSAEKVEEFRQVNIEYLSEQLRTRSSYLRGLPEAERESRIAEFAAWSVDNALLDEVVVAEADESMHSHGPSEWIPIEGAEDQAALQQQLRESGSVIGKFPTAADAMAGGYRQVTPYVPGIGAHYLNFDLLTDGEFAPGEPEMLLYNGNDPTSELVGLSYGLLSETAPEGFVGENDIWHQHPSLCLIDGAFVVGPDHTSEEMCASVGGRKGLGGEMQMAHVWQVPGWESSWGLFSGENPSLNMVTTDVGK